MLGIRYTKVPPTTYLIQYAAGKIKREGSGLSLFYYEPTTTLVGVPLNSFDIPFVFHQTTVDFQTVTVQGQFQYRIKDPRKLAGLLNYTIGPNLKYRSDDPEKLDERLTQTLQVLTQSVIARLRLKEALVSSEKLASEGLAAVRSTESVTMLGVEVLGLNIVSIRPTPEMAKALEAEAREELSKKADLAIYARRHNAVEQERKIKDAELNTELAVETKRREIRETQMAAEIAVEQQRAKLIEQRVINEKQDADAKAYALEATLKPIRDTDPKTLLALAAGNGSPKATIALAFRELAENAHKIGTLNISPELLEGLLKK